MPNTRTLEVRKRYVNIYGRNMTNFQLAHRLGVSERTISRYRTEPSRRSWSREELAYLKNNYTTLSASEMSKYLGRSKNTINIKSSQLGLVRTRRQQQKINRRCLKTAIKAIERDRNKRREAKVLRLMQCQSELLTRKIELQQLVSDALKHGNTNNHQVILAQKELSEIDKTEQEIEERYSNIYGLPSRKKNPYLI